MTVLKLRQHIRFKNCTERMQLFGDNQFKSRIKMWVQLYADFENPLTERNRISPYGDLLRPCYNIT